MAQEPVAASKVPFNIVRVHGKILRARLYERVWYTTLVCPAKDAYSKPAVVELRSKQRVGQPEDIVDVQCELGGFQKKAYSVTDKTTGEQRTVQPVELTLDLVE